MPSALMPQTGKCKRVHPPQQRGREGGVKGGHKEGRRGMGEARRAPADGAVEEAPSPGVPRGRWGADSGAWEGLG